MPIEPRDLLDLAKRLVGPNPGATEADLRRGISTAYYALFHLLVKAAMSNLVTDPSFRPRVGRAFQHGLMKQVCNDYRQTHSLKAGQSNAQGGQAVPGFVVASDVQKVAPVFFALHQAREKADYDDGVEIQHAEALTWIQEAESAFQAWLSAQADPISISFLQELFCRSILRK